METEVIKPDLKLRELPNDDEPLDKSETAVDTPLDLHTMRQQNQDKDPGPWKFFIEAGAVLFGVSLVIGFFAFWAFRGA